MFWRSLVPQLEVVVVMDKKQLPWGVYENGVLIAAFKTRKDAREYSKISSAPVFRQRTRIGILDDRDGVPFFKSWNPL